MGNSRSCGFWQALETLAQRRLGCDGCTDRTPMPTETPRVSGKRWTMFVDSLCSCHASEPRQDFRQAPGRLLAPIRRWRMTEV
jgi:hypothetical protein